MRKIGVWATCGFLALCLITAFLFSTGEVAPTITPKIPAPSPTPIVLEPGLDFGETYFSEPLVYKDLDIFPNIKTDTCQNATCVVYGSGEVCYISEPYSKYEKSQDGQKAALLTTSGKLWFIDAHGTQVLSWDVSDFSLAGNGSYLYYISNSKLYGYDPETTNIELLYVSAATISFMVSSPAGGYCAFSESTTQIRVWKRKSGTSFIIALETKITSVAAISEDGQWIYGYSPEIGFVRVNTANNTITQLSATGDMIRKLYFNKDATELYYEYEDTLYFCNRQKMPIKLLDLDSSSWNPLLEQQDDVYTREYLYVDNMFFYNGTFSEDVLVYGRNNLYQLKRDDDNISLESHCENVVWHNDFSVIYKKENTFWHCHIYSDLPHHNTISAEAAAQGSTIVNYANWYPYANGIIFYMDNKMVLHGCDSSTKGDLFALNFADVTDYVISKNGDSLYFLTTNGVLHGYAVGRGTQIQLGNFPSISDFPDVSLLAEDGGVYLRDDRESETKIYRLSLEAPYITYLGEEIYG